jgi:glycosyltransferase involved in cell wall biosynthesis
VRLLYVCLEPSNPGTAGWAHFTGFIQPLLSGDEPRVAIVRTNHQSAHRVSTKLVCIGFAILKAVLMLPRRNGLVLRYSPAALPLLLVAKVLGKHVTLMLHGVPEDATAAHPELALLTPYIRVAARLIVRHSDLVIAATPGIAAVARTMSEGRTNAVEVLSNGVDVDRYAVRDSGPRRCALFLGSLSPWQGLDELMDAAMSPAWPRAVPLRIVGSGSMGDRLLSRGLPDHVHLEAAVAPDNVPSVYAEAICSISPKTIGAATRAGVSPFKVGESLACGVPVVVTRIPGQYEIVEEYDCGIVVDPCSSEQIALAVAAIAASDTWSEMSNRARTAAVQRMSWVGKRRELITLIVANSRKDISV